MGAELASTVAALVLPDSTYRMQGASRGAVVTVNLAAALLFAASSVHGYATVDTCREITRTTAIPYQLAPTRQTAAQRHADEAAEEAAVQARLKEKEAEEAKEAKAAGEAAARTASDPKRPAPAR